jgi:lipooligosaccharide transport system permease protein
MTSLTLALRPLEYFFAQYRRVWRGTAVTSVITPVVYLLALGVGLGVFVDRSAELPGGITFLEFVAPGLLAATAMQLATFESCFPVLAAIKWDRQYHAMLATPLRVTDVVVGHQTFIAARLLGTSAVYLAVIAAFGAVNSPLGVLTIPVAVLVGLAFSCPLAAWAAHTETEVSFIAIFRFVILPMFLFSGTFFPVEELPAPLEVIAYFTPLYHGVELCRSLTRGTAELAPALGHLGFLLAVIGVGLAAAHVTYRRRLVL